MTDQTRKLPFWKEWGLPAPGTRMSIEEFEQLPEVNFHVELLHGVVTYPHWNEETMTPAPIPKHQKISGRIFRILDDYAEAQGGDAYYAPVDVYLNEDSLIQPDLIWLAPNGQCVETEKDFRGAPELVVEILSPGTARRDKTDKFDMFEKHGVQEYWIVDPRDDLIEVHVRDEDTLKRQGAYGPADVFPSPVLDSTSITVRNIFG